MIPKTSRAHACTHMEGRIRSLLSLFCIAWYMSISLELSSEISLACRRRRPCTASLMAQSERRETGVVVINRIYHIDHTNYVYQHQLIRFPLLEQSVMSSLSSPSPSRQTFTSHIQPGVCSVLPKRMHRLYELSSQLRGQRPGRVSNVPCRPREQAVCKRLYKKHLQGSIAKAHHYLVS
jgi:hypothetical protein